MAVLQLALAIAGIIVGLVGLIRPDTRIVAAGVICIGLAIALPALAAVNF